MEAKATPPSHIQADSVSAMPFRKRLFTRDFQGFLYVGPTYSPTTHVNIITTGCLDLDVRLTGNSITG